MKEKEIRELDLGIEVANNILYRINNIRDILTMSNEDPSVLLKEDIFLSELDLDFLLKNILLLLGEEYLDEFQLSFANKVISVIKNKIPYEEANLNIHQSDDGLYYIIVSTVIEDKSYPLLLINFYLKEIYYMEDEQTNNILTQIGLLQDEMAELEQYYERLELSKDNPIHYAGDNSIKMVDMLVRKKKYTEEISREKANTLDSISICNSKIYELKAILSEMEMDKIKCSIITDKYIDRLTKYFNYQVIKPTTPYEEIELKSDEELDFTELDFSNNP